MIPDPFDMADEILDSVDWNLLGVWFGAIATLLGAIGTVTAVFVAINNSKQARAASIEAQETAEAARRDTLDFRREEAQRKLRAQADQICAWIHDSHLDQVALLNSSDQPVYNVLVYSVWVQGAAWRTGEEAERHFANSENPAARIAAIRSMLQVVPPGKFRLRQGFSGQAIMQGRPGIEVAFTDMTGHHWVRRASGDMERLDAAPFDHYGIGRPLPEFTRLDPWRD